MVTTDSAHNLEVYLNLASRMKLTGIDQLWIADITYIRLKTEFVYLAVILDGFSRKVVGWSLGRTLASRLAITALEQAIAKRQPPPGLSPADLFRAVHDPFGCDPKPKNSGFDWYRRVGGSVSPSLKSLDTRRSQRPKLSNP